MVFNMLIAATTMILLFSVCLMWITRNGGAGRQIMTLNLARPFDYVALASDVAPHFSRFLASCESIWARLSEVGAVGEKEAFHDLFMKDEDNMKLFAEMYAHFDSLKMTFTERVALWETVLRMVPIPAGMEAGENLASLLA